MSLWQLVLKLPVNNRGLQFLLTSAYWHAVRPGHLHGWTGQRESQHMLRISAHSWETIGKQSVLALSADEARGWEAMLQVRVRQTGSLWPHS